MLIYKPTKVASWIFFAQWFLIRCIQLLSIFEITHLDAANAEMTNAGLMWQLCKGELQKCETAAYMN